MEFVHPILGILALLCMAVAAILGFKSRAGERGRLRHRHRHRRLGPVALAAMLLALCTGLMSTLWLRDDIHAATTWHGTLALGAVSLACIAALLSLGLPASRPLRTVHPLLGAMALLLGLFVAILGIELLP